ncbi:hypothetical protein [Sutcliffiella deserti]|uniref:hypothetical protein n=1 Tax=Sutcliffiella deserti TaxID=2875501 RepID=UPI001CBC3C04|nr:hypothetical protein [Sutcliffiella deserti]
MTTKEIKECGIIMPIAAMPGYKSDHWAEVKSIIKEATELVEGFEFKTSIVSDSNGEIDVIHKRIVQNIYNADIVVCDISGKNPNVMFELGMRLTFDKPTIIIKDDDTEYIFDTGLIEHITYPKDLRFTKVVLFKEELARKIKATYEKAQSTPDFSTFLGNFGQFKVPSLDQTTVTDANQYILEELGFLRKELNSFKNEVAVTKMPQSSFRRTKSDFIRELQHSIEKYIIANLEFGNAIELLENNDFKNYLDMNDFNVEALTRNTFLRVVREAQENALNSLQK